MEPSVDESETGSWSCLPDVVLVTVLSYMQWPDRARAALTCRAWHRQLSAPALWRRFELKFLQPSDFAQLQLIAARVVLMRDVTVLFDPRIEACRNSALEALKALGGASTAGTACLRRLAVCFAAPPLTGRGWADFASSLGELFLSGGGSLEIVDLSAYSIAPNDDLARALAAGCGRRLRSLDLLNGCPVTLLTPVGLRSLLRSCPLLERLAVRQASLSDDCLNELASEGRASLAMLRVAFGRQERYCADLSPQCWSLLAQRHRGSLQVSLAFDCSCPSGKVLAAMAPDAPVSSLRLLTRAAVGEELRFAAVAYSRTLSSLAVDAEPGPDFEQALLHLCDSCSELRTLHVVSRVGPSCQLALYERLCSRPAVDLRFGPLSEADGPW